jgi:hypothetical protein
MIYFGRRIVLVAFQHLTGYATPKKRMVALAMISKEIIFSAEQKWTTNHDIQHWTWE